jgi:hypothetical protein
MTVVNYPENFKDIVTLAVCLDDSFTRLDDIKRINPTKYPNKKKDLDAID